MAVLILNPTQDSILGGRPKNLLYPGFTKFTLNPNLIAKANTNHQARRKRSPNTSPPTSRATINNNNRNSTDEAVKKAPKLVLGQVRILKRGEKVIESESKVGDSELASTTKLIEAAPPTEARQDDDGRVDTELSHESKLIEEEQLLLCRRNRYAGLVLFTSPIPSSLPIPSFFTSSKAV